MPPDLILTAWRTNSRVTSYGLWLFHKRVNEG